MIVRVVAVAALMLAACGGAPAQSRLTVGAASSLADVVTELGEQYDGGALDLSVAGSQVLVAQVREGAPLDVVMTADRPTAERLEGLGLLAAPPVRFAGNRLAIAVATGNPLGIAGLADLADPELTVVLAAPQVPVGAYTETVLGAAGVEVVADSLEPSVRAVLAKVELGEADAGVVYVTDLTFSSADRVDIASELETSYYAAVVRESPRDRAAAEFVRFLTSEAAADVLARSGFLP